MVGLSGAYFFLGGIAMNIAGICEFILGNSELMTSAEDACLVRAYTCISLPLRRLRRFRFTLVWSGLPSRSGSQYCWLL